MIHLVEVERIGCIKVVEHIPLFEGTDRSVATVLASQASRRARQMRDEFTRVLTIVLAEVVGHPADEADGHSAAGLIVSTWSMAFAEGQRVFDRARDADAAQCAFLALIDRSNAGIAAALARTP